jgi:hypothetical protein
VEESRLPAHTRAVGGRDRVLSIVSAHEELHASRLVHRSRVEKFSELQMLRKRLCCMNALCVLTIGLCVMCVVDIIVTGMRRSINVLKCYLA